MRAAGRDTRTGSGGRGRAPRAATLLAGLVGLGFAAAAGCGDTAQSGGPGGNAAAENVAEARQGLTSAQACLTIQRPPGVPSSVGNLADVNIVSSGPTTNFGAVITVVAGTAGGVTRQTLIQLDLSAIPPGPNTNITVGTLNLSESNIHSSGLSTINVRRAIAAWTESGVTWNSFAGAYDPFLWGSFSNNFPTQGAPLNVNISSLIQAWVRGTYPNDGLVLESPAGATSFYSSEFAGSVYLQPNANVCYTVTCNPGFADCNNNGLDGCEVDTTTSVANCGGCGNACNVPNAAPACVGSACAVGACNLGFGDCNGSVADGCETLLTTSANCGACGVACALPNAAASCATGTCTLTACDAGHYDCDGNPANGCEATPCVNGSHCAGAAGCTSGVCANGFCAAPVCNDGVQNGGETAVDCGGGACPPCAVGKTCNAGADCVTGVCNGGACAAAACNDGVKNGGETAVDCGGACAACAVGQACLVGGDCTSGVCTAGLCQAPSCNDGLKNGSETAVDCGGGACPACVAGKSCNVASDCTDGVCTGNVCQLASCADQVQNGSETDVDCGGPCPPCNVAAKCATSADCGSGVCVNGLCQSPTCGDGVKNGDETGVDCGGACFKPEACNGVDDDCNGLVDDGLGSTTCGVGACQVTVQNCVGGKVQTCIPLPPHPESCDGLIDDDCDGVVDNGCACTDGKTQSCYTAAPSTLGVGLCQAGVQTCAHGQWGACAGEVTPTAETCDGLDNDCNGQADDGLGQTICGVGECQVTTPNCLNGLPQTCVPRPPQPELCDGLDNDCNGQVDDGLPAITCGLGACQRTAPSCVNGQAGSCLPGAPSPETCDGIDNDCDGVVDNGNPGGNAACSTGKLGACSAGTTACTGGGIVCNQNVQPHAETCNGLDDDCDGAIDNGNPGGNAACNTGKPGACAAGTTVCSGGQLSCSQSVQPSVETCDGLDNDCDGVVDNGDPGGGLACSTGLAGVCAAGTTACAAGQIACNEDVPPGPQQCNGLDDNCDGVVDEGCTCLNGTTQPCYSGAPGTEDVGVCHGGTQTCAGGNWGACVGEALPGAETCDGLDNDCNGQVDDGLGTVSCGVGQCGRTVAACVAGHANACVPGAPSPEVCDGLDNDCDGVADNGNPGANQACSTGKLGVCAAGLTACQSGAIACVQQTAPSVEVCDGLDNDCNGQVDEGLGATTCGAAGCSVTVQNCVGGVKQVCQPSQVDGQSCTDGNACTQTDTCHAGVCTGSNPVACSASDQCHGAGVCNPASGTCSNPPANNGTACNDGDACTQSDSCQSGVCTGSNPVICAASDQCHVAGACNPVSGTCSNPAANNGTACNDGNGCTQTDTCQGGACTGANPVVCAASDACHVAGACSPASGTCSNPAASNGTSCPDDGNPCTGDTCDGAGSCAHAAVASGTSCGAGLVCNGTVCSADCFIAGTLYAVGTVNPANPCQVCTPGTSTTAWSSRVNGTACNDGNACTQTDTCQAGVCTGGNPVACAASDQCHTAGVCNPVNGTCSNPAANNGTACNDGNACTQTDTCQAGACTGSNPVVCAASDQCHVAGVCSPASGTCSNPAANNGTACNDGNACTQTDTCQSGTCTGSNPVVCAASDQCHVAGVCSPASGTCSNPAANNGTACNDGNACTQTDTCQAGACTGANPVVCSASDQCHVAGVCSPASGTCSNPTAANGTSCSDGNACTKTDQCTSGVCGGTAYTCSATSCDVSASCDGNGGCTVVDKVAGTSCPDDGNPCTSDTCDGTGSCAHPAVATGTSCGAGLVCNGTVCSADCFIAGTLYAAGTVNPANACQVCTPGTSTTAWSSQANGTVCSDGNACTQTDTCQAGTCTGSNPVVCGASDQCHVVGVCSPASGLCSNPTRANGTSCNDGNACTQTDTCQLGVCTGSNPVVCVASDQCHVVGVCDTGSGTCSNPAAANGTSCNDSNACTRTDTCQAGACSGGNPVVCTALDACHSVGTCATATGTCSNPVIGTGVLTTYYKDGDGDTYGSPSVTTQACSLPNGYVTNSSDCNDGNAAVHPGATEICNGVDDNCNGSTDEGNPGGGVACGSCGLGTTVCSGGALSCSNASAGLGTYYRDADGDGFGSPSLTQQGCSQPGGYVANSSDCNDGNASVHPGAAEVCNGVDDNCNGSIDEGGSLCPNGACSAGTCHSSCSALTPAQWTTDLLNNAQGLTGAVSAAACQTYCNSFSNTVCCMWEQGSTYLGFTNPCWSFADTACRTGWQSVPPSDPSYTNDSFLQGTICQCPSTSSFCHDADGDGYGNPSVTTQACSEPVGYTSVCTDCNDANAAIHPGAAELCNGVDDNCDGTVDGPTATPGPYTANSGSWTVVSGGNWETGTKSGWTDITTALGVFNPSTAQAARGSWSIVAQTSTAFNGSGYGLGHTVAVTAGQTYVLSGFFYTLGASSGTLYVDLNDVSFDPNMGVPMNTPGGWQFVYRQFTVPSGFSSVFVRLVRDGNVPLGQPVYLDEVAVTPLGQFAAPTRACGPVSL